MPKNDLDTFRVYDRETNKLLKKFSTRKNAVFWCKVNQESPMPDGEWEDDFYIQSPGKPKDFY